MVSNCVAIKGRAEIEAVTTEDLQQTDIFFLNYFQKSLKIEVLGMSLQNTKVCCLASNLLGEWAVFHYQGQGKKCFDNDFKTCFTATGKVSSEKKTKMHTCMV